MVKELLLGDNPFIGVSHLAHEKARETQRTLTLERKIEVIKAAVEGGATGFTFSTHSANLELLRYMKDHYLDLLKKLNYYILVPYATKYVREATKIGTANLVKNIIKTSITKENFALLLIPKPTSVIKLFLLNELKPYLEILPKSNVKAILMHEVLTELITAFNLSNVVEDLAKFFENRGLGFGLETRNITMAERLLNALGRNISYIMTPMNPLGYQMAPSREEAEQSIIRFSREGVKIIAINVLASGALSLGEAVDYFEKYRNEVYAVAVGTSNPERARQTFKMFSKLVSG